MRALRAWLVRLASIFRRTPLDTELREELESHLQMHMADNVLAGMTNEAARRVGLTPFIAAAEEKFDAQRHQVVDGQTKPVDGAPVDETLANGYTFQGKLLRPAVVRLRNDNGTPDQPVLPQTNTETATQPAEDELPLT